MTERHPMGRHSTRTRGEIMPIPVIILHLASLVRPNGSRHSALQTGSHLHQQDIHWLVKMTLRRPPCWTEAIAVGGSVMCLHRWHTVTYCTSVGTRTGLLHGPTAAQLPPLPVIFPHILRVINWSLYSFPVRLWHSAFERGAVQLDD